MIKKGCLFFSNSEWQQDTSLRLTSWLVIHYSFSPHSIHYDWETNPYRAPTRATLGRWKVNKYFFLVQMSKMISGGWGHDVSRCVYSKRSFPRAHQSNIYPKCQATAFTTFSMRGNSTCTSSYVWGPSLRARTLSWFLSTNIWTLLQKMLASMLIY